MSNKAKTSNISNHARQKSYLAKGIVMLPKKPIREKSRNKQLRAAMLKLKSRTPAGKHAAV